MIDTRRGRWTALACALLCAGLFVALAVLVDRKWRPLLDLDRTLGRRPFAFTSDHHWVQRTAEVVAAVFHPNIVLAVGVLAGVALALKGYRRAGAWAVIVLAVSRVASPEVKDIVQRPRPHWAHPLSDIGGFGFPSGHATAIAAGAWVAIVLSGMLIRRRGLRRAVGVLAVLLALAVGADRVLLGVHSPSDVVAGFLLSSAVALLALVVYDPQPRSIALVMDPLPEAIPSSERRVAAILNPVKVDDPAGFRVMVEKMALESGWQQVSWWETTVEDTGYQMAHEAAVSGADLVLAIGGDGTIRAVCEELAGTGIPVGIVPAGTGNLLARNLSIPLYLRAAVDVGLNGQDRAIDMVRVTGDEMEDATFLVMAGMGFDAAIMEGVNETFKQKVGWLAYVWSALKALMFPAIRVEVSVDGGPFTRHRARTLVIGNVGHLQAGMPLIPDAAIDDGQLDVVMLYPRRFLSWVPIAARVLTRNKRTDETITRMTGREVIVRTQAPAPRQLDGDLIAPGKELRAECIHGRLLVRVPR
ncbi:diacylglycerol kinase family protein [Nocardioides pocheonensis]|uniref:diacylglycerol kinase family protein n=1 Tax=Nocardioides pocheonensis TaxID=661485 RepID=UPI001FEBD76C|nr:diacylglycerol kinase family protein [Nocardioides pocheonensis]